MRKLIPILMLLLCAVSTVAAATIGTIANSDALYTGETRSDFAGSALAVIGDINNDGYDDFAVASQSNSSGGTRAGTVYLIYGSAVVASQPLTDTIELTGTTNQYAGSSVSAAGDVNADGYDDFLIGATGGGGRAFLVLGDSAELSPTDLNSSAIIYSGAAGDYAGGDVAAAGDVNNDGYDDFLISAIGSSASAQYGGAVYLVLGSATPSSSDLSDHIALTGGQDYMNLGSLAGVGDVNGDGYDDIMVGASGYSSGGVEYIGAGWLIPGSATPSGGEVDALVTAGKAYRFTGSDAYSGIGTVRGAGDLNNDGYDDALIFDRDGEAPFNVYLLPGAATLAGYPLSAALKWSSSESLWIATPVPVGDLNADGYDDVMIPSSGYNSGDGAVFIAYGSSTISNLTIDDFDHYVGGAGAGVSTVAAGDVNNDGEQDLLFGMSSYSSSPTMQRNGAAFLMLSGSSSAPTAVAIQAHSAEIPHPPIALLLLLLTTTCVTTIRNQLTK